MPKVVQVVPKAVEVVPKVVEVVVEVVPKVLGCMELGSSGGALQACERY